MFTPANNAPPAFPRVGQTAHSLCRRVRHHGRMPAPRATKAANGQSLSTTAQPVPTLSLKRAAALLLYLSCMDQQGS